MNYMEYNTEYQKVILKEELKRKIRIKEILIDTVKNTDKRDVLEMLIMSNDFDRQIKFDELMLQDLGDDEEFKELIENDIEVTEELKKVSEDRLRELKEQEKGKKTMAKKEDEQGQEQDNADEEHDEHSGKEHNSEQNSSVVNNDMERHEDLQFMMPTSRERVPVYGSQEYYVADIKYQIKISIILMQSIKANVDKCPSPMMLMYMNGKKEVFDGVQDLARNIQTMPGCDEELKMLTTEEIKAAQEVKDTVDKYIEQYKQRAKEDSKNKNDEQNSLEEMEERLQQEDEEKGKENEGQGTDELEQEDDGLEQESNELEQEDNNTPRKSWELPPEQKAEIQIGAQQIAQDYNEKQANPEPQIEQNVVDNSDISR